MFLFFFGGGGTGMAGEEMRKIWCDLKVSSERESIRALSK